MTNVLPTEIYIPLEREAKILKSLESGKPFGTITALCEDAGITRDAWYDAVKKPDFVAHLINNNKSLLYASFPTIIKKIVEQANRGSYAHQKMILEMLQVYQGDKPTVNIQNNIQNNFNIDDAWVGFEELAKQDPVRAKEIIDKL